MARYANKYAVILFIALGAFVIQPPSGEAQEGETKPTYQDSQRDLLSLSSNVAIYGVVLEHDDRQSDIVVIQLAGMSAGDRDIRQCSKRIIHVPADKIRQSESVDDFSCDGHKAEKFVLSGDALLVEELYDPILARDLFREESTMMRRYSDDQFGQDCFYRCTWTKRHSHNFCEQRCQVSMPNEYGIFAR